MNCCDSFGNCNQGRDCPVRAGTVSHWAPLAQPDAAATPSARTCDELGVCNGSGNCPGCATTKRDDTGAFWLPYPAEDLTFREVAHALAYFGLCIVAIVAAVGYSGGWL